MVSVPKPRIETLAEWKTCQLDGMVLAPEDQQLATSLAGTKDTRIALDELRSGLRISTRSWVGVVRFSGFELRVIPKLVGGDAGLVKLIDFAKGLDALKRHPASRTFEAERDSLFDLVALLLAESCEDIARNGLLADYRETEDDLPVLRGRLLLRKQLLQRMGRLDRLECRYDEHTTDTVENQLLLAALTVCGPRVQNAVVALRVRRMLGIFSEACGLDDLDLRVARTAVSYNRLNEHYKDAHGLAGLILDGLGIDDLYAGGGHRTFAFLLDMNQLFEDFVTRWLGILIRGTEFRVLAQRRDPTILWNADSGRSYSRVIPDLLIERVDQSGMLLPLDAKYKLYDDKNVTPADIYQNFLYAYAYGHQHAALPTGIVLYPSSASTPGRVRLHVRRQNGLPVAELRAIGVNIADALSEAQGSRIGPQGQAVIECVNACMKGQREAGRST